MNVVSQDWVLWMRKNKTFFLFDFVLYFAIEAGNDFLFVFLLNLFRLLISTRFLKDKNKGIWIMQWVYPLITNWVRAYQIADNILDFSLSIILMLSFHFKYSVIYILIIRSKFGCYLSLSIIIIAFENMSSIWRLLK